MEKDDEDATAEPKKSNVSRKWEELMEVILIFSVWGLLFRHFCMSGKEMQQCSSCKTEMPMLKNQLEGKYPTIQHSIGLNANPRLKTLRRPTRIGRRKRASRRQ